MRRGEHRRRVPVDTRLRADAPAAKTGRRHLGQGQAGLLYVLQSSVSIHQGDVAGPTPPRRHSLHTHLATNSDTTCAPQDVRNVLRALHHCLDGRLCPTRVVDGRRYHCLDEGRCAVAPVYLRSRLLRYFTASVVPPGVLAISLCGGTGLGGSYDASLWQGVL